MRTETTSRNYGGFRGLDFGRIPAPAMTAATAVETATEVRVGSDVVVRSVEKLR
ncbi:hypothetical protein Droror1_Dr00000777, partial [Drosera rotundifolia]